MSTQPMPLVQVFAPDGTLGDIPYDRLHDAIGAGAKLATKIKAPDGTMGYVPADQRGAALKAGGTAIPFDLSDADGEKPGFWSHVKQSFQSMTQGPQDIGEAVKQGLSASTGALPTLYNAGKEAIAAHGRGHDLPYSAAAGLSTAVGINPERMENAANQGDASGVLGEAAIPTALAAGGLAGDLSRPAISRGLSGAKPELLNYADALRHPTEIPGRIAEAVVNSIPDSPEVAAAKQRVLEETQATEINKARAMQDVYLRRQAAQQAAADKAAAKAALEPKATPAQEIPKGTNYGQFIQEQKAAVKAVQKAKSEGTGVNVVPEPRGNFTGEVPGYMASVPRGTLEDLALGGKPGAAVQLQQLGRPILYEPRGAGISNVKSSVSLSDMAPGKPEWAYRVRDVGEKGVPANATERRAHATTSLEDAQGIMQDRGSVTGKEQETVRYDLSKLKEGVDYLRHPREGQPDWIQMLRPVPESAIRRVPVQ